MPTGYTADVQSGKITTLREYALRCARGFGALIMMRDEPHDTPIPEQFVPRTEYHDKLISRARDILDTVPSLSATECDRRAGEEYEGALERHVEHVAEAHASKTRYAEMRAKVEAWEVPDSLRELRAFMLQQIQESTKYDNGCEPEPLRKTGEAWRAAQLESASRDLAYGTTERDKEISRVNGRNQWLAALRASLAMESRTAQRQPGVSAEPVATDDGGKSNPARQGTRERA